MKTKAVSKGILAGLVFSLLSAGVSMGAPAEGNVRMSRIERSAAAQTRSTQAPRTHSFRSEKTDSWLCDNVSVFFCSNIPTLGTTDPPPAAPVRGRK